MTPDQSPSRQTRRPENLLVLGSTGSIGKNCLEIVTANPDRFRLFGVAGRKNLKDLANQIETFSPGKAVVWNKDDAADLQSQFSGETEILAGMEGLEELASHPEVDTVVNALVGSVGLRPTIAALKAGKKVALANKESMVIGGEIINELLAGGSGTLLPIDSEHSALHQCLGSAPAEYVERLLLTASGGPFLNRSRQEMENATPRQALAHPNWEMGSKITIDSATMMNKGLEVIEAHFLFKIPYDRIEVVVHPQSIIHSMVQYRDGSVLAQLGPPDMRIPIQYALTHPDRLYSSVPRANFARIASLNFQPPDWEKFPCLRLAFEAGKAGGSMPAVLNAANEVAVARFLKEEIAFGEIPTLIESAMSAHTPIAHPDLDEILAVDRETRSALPARSRS